MSSKRRRELRQLERMESGEITDFGQRELKPTCEDRAQHWENLIIWGHCARCEHAWSLSYE